MDDRMTERESPAATGNAEKKEPICAGSRNGNEHEQRAMFTTPMAYSSLLALQG